MVLDRSSFFEVRGPIPQPRNYCTRKKKYIIVFVGHLESLFVYSIGRVSYIIVSPCTLREWKILFLMKILFILCVMASTFCFDYTFASFSTYNKMQSDFT